MLERVDGEGLMTAGFSTRDMATLKANLEPSETLGMRVVLTPDAARP